MNRAQRVLLAAAMVAAGFGTTVGTATVAHAETHGTCSKSQEGQHRYLYSSELKAYAWFTCERGWWRRGFM